MYWNCVGKVPEDTVNRIFPNLIQADVDFCQCLLLYCFNHQVFASCMGLLLEGPRFFLTETEIGAGAAFASLSKGIKIGVPPLLLPVQASLNVVATPLKVLSKYCSAVHVNARCVIYSSLYYVRAIYFYFTSFRSCRSNFQYWFVNNFIKMEHCRHFKSAVRNSNIEKVHLPSSSW